MIQQRRRESMTSLPAEHILEIRAGDIPIGTPDRLDELATGWAFAQGLQVTASTHIFLARSGQRVRHRHATELSRRQSTPHATMDRNAFKRQVKIVFDLFRDERGAGGYHHAALMGEDAARCLIRDISRHNAIDKAVGHALRQGMDISASAIVLSGKITTGIAPKTARSGVPIVATRSLPTAQAVAFAEAVRLMLACRILNRRHAIYGPNRLSSIVTGQDTLR
jgi:formate dehydrogenase assembly factor FdhD